MGLRLQVATLPISPRTSTFATTPSSKSIDMSIATATTSCRKSLESGTICLVFVTKTRFRRGFVEVAHGHASIVRFMREGQVTFCFRSGGDRVPSENLIEQHSRERLEPLKSFWMRNLSRHVFHDKAKSCDLFVTTRHANVLHPKPINGRQCRMAAAFEPTAMPVPAHSLTSGPDERGIPHS